MKSMIDVYQLLKQYGTYIYTGDRYGDLQLIHEELQELYKSNMLEPKLYQTAVLLIRQEERRLKAEKKQ